MGDVFYQQMVEQAIEGKDKTTKIITKNQQGDVLASSTIENPSENLENIQTKVVAIEGNDEAVRVLTLTEDGKILHEEEIQKELDEEINGEYIENFHKKAKGKNYVKKSYDGNGNFVKSWQMEPVLYNDEYY